MGVSRSFPIWYPLSLNCCPNGLSLGQTSWHEEQGMPYLRANAGIARTLPAGLAKAGVGLSAIEKKSQLFTAMNATVATRCFFNFRTSCNIVPPRPSCSITFSCNITFRCNITHYYQSQKCGEGPHGLACFSVSNRQQALSEKSVLAPCRLRH